MELALPVIGFILQSRFLSQELHLVLESTKLPFLDMVKDDCNLVSFIAHVKYSTELYFITELVTQEQLYNWKINNATTDQIMHLL